MPYAGRGGAGNIQAVDEANKRIAEDLEANQQSAESESHTPQPPPSQEEQYARVGRGGAGNFYDPQLLSEADKVNLGDGYNSLGSGGTTGPTIDASKAPFSEPTRTFGRGGAGNYSFDASENQDRALRKKLAEDEEKKKVLKEQVERGVQETLAMPAQAKLPVEKP